MKSKALFLDRDGVINEDYGFIGSPDRFVFRDGIFSFLRAAQGVGYRLVVVTNQSGVARGYYTEEDYEIVTTNMLCGLAAESITIESVETCFELKGGAIAAYARDSFWRKPNPGMILDAAQRLRLDLSRSAMIGDKNSDMLAAKAAGVPLRLFMPPPSPLTLCQDDGAKTVINYDAALVLLTAR